jgi:hypothetical protein
MALLRFLPANLNIPFMSGRVYSSVFSGLLVSWFHSILANGRLEHRY